MTVRETATRRRPERATGPARTSAPEAATTSAGALRTEVYTLVQRGHRARFCTSGREGWRPTRRLTHCTGALETSLRRSSPPGRRPSRPRRDRHLSGAGRVGAAERTLRGGAPGPER